MKKLLLAVAFLLAPFAAYATDPSGLTEAGVASNVHIRTLDPLLCWSYSGTQSDYRVQVDDDPNFNGDSGTSACSTVFFWDTGEGSKSNANAHCINSRSQVNCRFNANLEYRPIKTYWRVKVKEGSTWSNWVSDTMALNFEPLPSTGLTASVNALYSTDAYPSAYNPAAAGSPATYYVDNVDPNSVDDPNHGTSAAPFRTIQYATTRLVAGDTLKIKNTDTYYENVVIKKSTHASGDATNPITVVADTTAPTILGTSPTIWVQSGVHDWVFKTLKVGVASTTANPALNCAVGTTGIYIDNADNIVIDGFTTPTPPINYQSATTPRISSMCVVGNDNRIINSTFNTSQYDYIDAGGHGLIVQGNTFDGSAFDPNGALIISEGIYLSPGRPEADMIFDSNYVHNYTVAEGFIHQYKAGRTRYSNNVFYQIGGKGGNSNRAIWADRSGPLQAYGNTFFRVQGAAIAATFGVGFIDAQNNIFAHDDPNGTYGGTSNKNAAGIYMQGVGGNPGGSARNTNVIYNDFYQLLGGTTVFNPASDANTVTDITTGNLAADPNFGSVDPNDFATTFLRPDTGATNILDPNGAALPVPTSGGTFRAMGRFETDATCITMTCIYDYQNQISNLMDTSPKFSWTFYDEGNALETCCDWLPAGDTQAQTKFEIQVDASPSFNTRSPAHPTYDSGVVTSSTSAWTVPDASALDPNIAYYVRVRTSNDDDPNTLGEWTYSPMRFGMDTDSETAAPVLTYQYPATGATGLNCAPLLITVMARDLGGGITCSSSGFNHMIVDGVEHISDSTFTTVLGTVNDPPGTKNSCSASYSANLALGAHTFQYKVHDAAANELDSGSLSFTCSLQTMPPIPSEPRIVTTTGPLIP